MTNYPFNLIDSVDWASLSHAYGEATDVPADLRALVSPDPKERKAAYYSLQGTIYHQGSRYSASVPAVPYLLAILKQPSTPDRAHLIDYIMHLALGYDNMHLPDGINMPAWRAQIAELESPDYEAVWTRRMDDWIAQAPDDRARRWRHMMRAIGFKQGQEESLHAFAVYGAVREGVPVFGDCLEDESDDVRLWAAYALAWFPEERATSAPLLERLMDCERNDDVHACAIIALGLLFGCSDGDVVPPEGIESLVLRLRGYADDAAFAAQWAAAVALVRLKQEEPRHVDVVVRCLADRVSIENAGELGFPFYDGNIVDYSADVVAGLDIAEHPGAASAVLDALSRSAGVESLNLVSVAFRLAFGSAPSETIPFEKLSAFQQRTVEVLANMDQETWEWGSLAAILEKYKIPSSQEECRKYAGL
ncbi:hypothetical protein BJX96DRAFT_143752 [Aspergillus floccosus]